MCPAGRQRENAVTSRARVTTLTHYLVTPGQVLTRLHEQALIVTHRYQVVVQTMFHHGQYLYTRANHNKDICTY